MEQRDQLDYRVTEQFYILPTASDQTQHQSKRSRSTVLGNSSKGTGGKRREQDGKGGKMREQEGIGGKRREQEGNRSKQTGGKRREQEGNSSK